MENGAFWADCSPRRAVFTQVPAALPTKTILALLNHPIQPSQCKKSPHIHFLWATTRAKIRLKRKMAPGFSKAPSVTLYLSEVD